MLNVPGHAIHGVIISFFLWMYGLNVKRHTIHGVIITSSSFLSILTYCLQERKSHARHLLSARVKQPL